MPLRGLNGFVGKFREGITAFRLAESYSASARHALCGSVHIRSAG